MSDLQVRELNINEYELWDKLVNESPHGTIFHTSDWLKLCRDTLNNDLKIYGCFKEDELIGGCSLFIRKSHTILKYASSNCEMTPYGGIVIKNISMYSVRKQFIKLHQILDKLSSFLAKLEYDHIYICFPPEFQDIRPFTWNGWDSKVLYAYYLNLEKNIDMGLSNDLKKNISKARKNGITVKKMRNPSLYYNLFSMVFKRQKLETPVTLSFFKELMKLFNEKKMGDMWVAQTPSEEYIGAHIRLWDQNRAYAWTAASDPSFRKSGANSLLYYEIIKELKENGFKEINMMSANTFQFTNFIASFNPELVAYYSVSYSSWRVKCLKSILYRR